MKLVLGVLALVLFAGSAIADESVVVNGAGEGSYQSAPVGENVRPAEQAIREIARHRRHRRHHRRRHHRRRHHRRW